MSEYLVKHKKNIVQTAQVSLLGESLDVRRNLLRLLDEHYSYVLLLLVTVGLDAVSTIAFMSVIGTGAEQNPLVRQLSNSLGIIVGPPIGKLFQVLAAIGLSIITPRLTRFILTTVILVNLFAFVVNMRIFLLH